MTDVDPTAEPADLLGLPPKARIGERLTKKLLTDQAVPGGGADTKLIGKSVESATIEGLLRPETVQVPAARGGEREVDYIPVLRIRLNEKVSPAECARLADLVFRSMPRPIVLFIEPAVGRSMLLAVALTHVNMTDPERATSVVDDSLIVPVDTVKPGALRVDVLDRTDLWALYRDLVRRAASKGLATSAVTATDALAAYHRIVAFESELAGVVRDAKREKSQAGRIRLNTRARELRAQIKTVGGTLYSAADDAATTPATSGGPQQ